MTHVVCCQEAKSGDKGEATLDLAIWRSLVILSRSAFVVGGADTERHSNKLKSRRTGIRPMTLPCVNFKDL